MVSTSMKSSSGLFEAEFEAEISWVSGTILVGFGGLGTGCTSTLTVCCSATKITVYLVLLLTLHLYHPSGTWWVLAPIVLLNG